MGLFNWFRWQLERRAMLKEMDRLRADLSETERQLYYAKRDKVTLRSDLGEAEQLLHEAQNGAKLAAEEQNKLQVELVRNRNAAGYWETQANQKQKRIEEVGMAVEKLRAENEILRQQANTLTAVTKPAESELERKAWEVFIRFEHYNIGQAFELAEGFIEERDRLRKEKEQETQNNGPF